jgi:Uma2 family endonuclease
VILNSKPSGRIIATHVTAEDYLRDYSDGHTEWVRGTVIQMSPSSLKHHNLLQYVNDLLKAYLVLQPIGRVIQEPFVQRLEDVASYREPDLMVILNDNPGDLTDTAMIGPADICIEVVSRESTTRDYGEKFAEYEAGGVSEYWILDPLRDGATFYRLNDDEVYTQVIPTNDVFTTPLLPDMSLHIPTLWATPLPDMIEVIEAVRKMVNEG